MTSATSSTGFCGDNGTFSLTFTAPYLDGRAEPITGVHKIAGLLSRWRDYVVDGQPLANGVVPIGDALLATNPPLWARLQHRVLGCTSARGNAPYA